MFASAILIMLQPGCRTVECRGGRSGLVGSTAVQPCLRQSIPRHRWTMDAALFSPEPPAGYCPVPFAVNWMKSGPRGIHKTTVQSSSKDCVTQLNPCVGKKISWYNKARKVSHTNSRIQCYSRGHLFKFANFFTVILYQASRYQWRI